MELIKILKNLDKKFPEKTISEWDKSGLQIFNNNKISLDRDIHKVLVCLDINQEVANKILEEKVDLIISRHPLIFEDINIEKQNPSKNKIMISLTKANVIVLAIHSNYDNSNNDLLTNMLEDNFSIKKIKRWGMEKNGYYVNLKEKVNLDKLKKIMLNIFENNDNLTNLKWDDGKLIDHFYIASGSAAQLMIEEKLINSTFIVGEAKWNHWIYANDNSNNLLVLGHYMENYFVKHLSAILQNAWPNLEIIKFNINNQYKN